MKSNFYSKSREEVTMFKLIFEAVQCYSYAKSFIPHRCSDFIQFFLWNQICFIDDYKIS